MSSLTSVCSKKSKLPGKRLFEYESQQTYATPALTAGSIDSAISISSTESSSAASTKIPFRLNSIQKQKDNLFKKKFKKKEEQKYEEAMEEAVNRYKKLLKKQVKLCYG